MQPCEWARVCVCECGVVSPFVTGPGWRGDSSEPRKQGSSPGLLNRRRSSPAPQSPITISFQMKVCVCVWVRARWGVCGGGVGIGEGCEEQAWNEMGEGDR